MDKNTHILLLSSWFPTDKNPFLGNFVQRQAQLLGKKYKVTVLHTVASNIVNPSSKESEREGYTEIMLSYNGNGHILARKKQERLALINGFTLLQNVDLIIGNVLLPKGWQFLMAKKRFKCPLFYIEHGSYFYRDSVFRWSRIDRWMRKKLEKKSTEIIAVSEVLKSDLQHHFPKRKIEVIGNHIDTELFVPLKKNKMEKTQFLHVSTLDPNTKNPKGIIDACKLLLEQTDQFNLTIACDENSSYWATYSESQNCSKNITFIGPLEWEALVPYYQNSDAFVLFSEYESFSIVIAEAWATGTPVISTSVGIASNMNKELGIQVQSKNLESLKNAMLSIIEDKIVFDSSQIIRKAKEFGSEAILKKWEKLIEKHVG
ncbi:glycosyltransferase family 4 protein [Crocinitomicaceae bacterium]|nr:glycosyltransferase family 4 protein [Crocinitomicaceae bacterium]